MHMLTLEMLPRRAQEQGPQALLHQGHPSQVIISRPAIVTCHAYALSTEYASIAICIAIASSAYP